MTHYHLWSGIINRSESGTPRKEDDPVDGWYELSEDEKKRLRQILEDAYNAVCRIFVQFDDPAFRWSKERLHISSERKTYKEIFEDRRKLRKEEEEELRGIRVLGEYRHKDSVTLYYNNIKDAAENAPEGGLGNKVYTVMRYVYFHELMHQYFDRFDSEKDEMEIEEGLAEFGALYVLDSLVEKGEADTAELDWTLKHVEGKYGPLRCYSYGAGLFKRYKAGHLELKNILEAYC